MKTKKTKKKYPKLTPRERELAGIFIPEEIETGKYKRSEAVAIGISRARRLAAAEKRPTRVRKIDAIIAKYA